MRYLALAIAVVFLAPFTADAQRASAARKLVEQQQRRAAPPPPGFENPLYDRTHRDRRDHRGPDRKFDRWPQTHRPRWNSQPHRRPLPFGSYYAVPSYGYGFGFYGPAIAAEEVYEPAPAPRANKTMVTTGTLRLEVTPATGLDYYVDGLYIGNSSNLGTRFQVNAGGRRVEVRAAGYRSLVFDTRITAGGETTFRGSLEPATQPLPPPASGNRSMFIIPGCYMGNSRPVASELRPGCDINKLITR